MEPTRTTLVRSGEDTARTITLSLVGLTVGLVPLPFVPDTVVERVRGALVHDIAARAGLSLAHDARDVLAAGSSGTFLRGAAETLLRRVLRGMLPIGALASVARAGEIYALGHLFERWVSEHRGQGAIRVHREEAEALRACIDRALLRALSPSLSPRNTLEDPPIEDLRDEFTRWTDSAILWAAKVPGYLVRRLDAAFDEAVAEHPVLRRA